MNPVEYFEEALALFEGATSYSTDQITIAERKVHLKAIGDPDLRDLFLPSLAHLLDLSTVFSPDLTIWYGEDKHLSKKMKAPPWEGFNGQGYNADLSQDDVQVFFQPWQTQIFLYSASRKTGIYWVRKSEDVPWWECTFSFRAIFHLWSRDLPAQLVHAGAISKNGSGVLITGQSGSGKTTSCLNLLRAGYDYLGDDYVWVELDEQIKVYTLYHTAKIEPENLDKRFAEWKGKIRNKSEYRSQKAIFDIKDLYPEAAVAVTALKAILLPKVAHQETTHYVRANPTQSLMAMAPTTLHHLPHNRQNAYQKMMRISSNLPGYHWHLGSERTQFLTSFYDFFNNDIT